MTRFVLILAFLAATCIAAEPLQHGPQTLSGTVTFAEPKGAFFFFRTDAGAWWRAALNHDQPETRPGDYVTLRGDVLYQTVNNRIDHCVLMSVEHREDFEPSYENVSVSQLHEHPVMGSTEPDRFARLVSVSGRVTDINRRMTAVQVMLSDGQKSLTVTSFLRAECPLPEEPPLARTLAGGLLMILQEAVGNAIRHGQARHVAVRVSFEAHRLVLTIVDNGCGFDCGATSAKDLGLGFWTRCGRLRREVPFRKRRCRRCRAC